MKKVKWISLIMAVVLMAGLLGACSSDSETSSQQAASQSGSSGSGGSAPAGGGSDATLTFMGWGSPQEEETFNAMLAQYKDMYGVDVTYINVPPDDFPTKLQTMIASNQTPDVFYLQPERVMPYAKNGILYDMTDYVANNQIFDQDNVWTKALDMYRYDGKMPGVGSIYGLPKDIGPFALAYNRDLFREAGIPDPDTAWTWDEFIVNAGKLTKGSGNDKVYGSAPYSLESALWSHGADFLDASKTQVTVDDPVFIEAVQWMADLALVHGVVPTSDEDEAYSSFQRWMDGKIGMIGIGPWSQGQFWADLEFDWDLMPWPVSPRTGNNSIWYGGMGFAVANSSSYIKEACDLAAFLAFNEDAQRTSMQMGQSIPNLIDMAKNEYLQMDKKPANKQEFLNIVENPNYGRRATQTFTYNSEWFGEFVGNVAAVWRGEQTAEDFCKAIKAPMQALLDKGIEEQNR